MCVRERESERKGEKNVSTFSTSPTPATTTNPAPTESMVLLSLTRTGAGWMTC